MARKLSIEELAKAKLGYLWDYLPEEARERARAEARAEKETAPLAKISAKIPRRDGKSIF